MGNRLDGRGADIQRRVFAAAQSAIRIYRRIYRSEPELRDVGRQFMKAVTSVGANLEEADAAHSRADFVAKCVIALKESRESHYWARLLKGLPQADVSDIAGELNEITAIRTTIVRRARATDEIREDGEDYTAW